MFHNANENTNDLCINQVEIPTMNTLNSRKTKMSEYIE